MHKFARACVWEKTTPLLGKNNTPPTVGTFVRIADRDRLILRSYGLLCAEEALADLTQTSCTPRTRRGWRVRTREHAQCLARRGRNVGRRGNRDGARRAPPLRGQPGRLPAACAPRRRPPPRHRLLRATFTTITSLSIANEPPGMLRVGDRGDGTAAGKETARQRYAHINAGHVPD